ncbi:MAG: SH3 domain-containing protein [Candidatus Promineifilaceae bacterium]
MARYRQPPDPPTSDSELRQKRPRRQRRDGAEPIPWLWLALGGVVAIFGVLLAFVLASILLTREPLTTAFPTPTVIRLTAPPTVAPTQTPLLPTPTAIPTFTPPPTPDVSVAPAEITVGYYAVVANTGNVGVSLRAGPSTDNLRLELVPEGTPVLVLDGPQDGNGFVWWQVQLAGGAEGWIVSDFLEPSAAP